MSKGLSTWIWVMGSLVISFIVFSFFFKIISDLTIEKHKQDTIGTLDMIASDTNLFCNTRSLSTIKKMISLSDFVRVVYTSDNGDDQTINYTSHGSNICVKFIDDVECKPLVCQIEMRSYAKEESLISLIDKISGKLDYKNYILKIHRVNDIVDVEISRMTETTITNINTTTTIRTPETSTTTTVRKENQLGCGGEFKSYNPPYELYPLAFPLDFYGIYSSDPLRKIVDNCISLNPSELERAKCIINWSYNNFPQTYDYSYNCWCIGRKNLRPNDVISCAENLQFPDTCEGCGVCVDFSTTLYSMLVSCGPECNINTDNLYLVSGCLAGRKLGETENSCVGCHSWLLYNHPDEGWIFVDPTNPSLASSIDQYFSKISDYPCITFFIQNLDNNYMYSTPDDKVDNELCPGWGINMETCPS